MPKTHSTFAIAVTIFCAGTELAQTPAVSVRENRTGAYVTYWLEAMDEKTGKRCPVLPSTEKPIGAVSWKRFEYRYQIVNQDPNGDWVSVRLLLANAKSKTETHFIECGGMSDSTRAPLAVNR